nr:alpha-1,6-mannosyl-glycoprotein 2-beta-N-acetylglucosaminyltransferase-like [Lytechinus pictus]
MRLLRTIKTFLFACAGISALWMVLSLLGGNDDDNMEDYIIQRAKQPRAKDQGDSVGDENNDVYKNVEGNKLTLRETDKSGHELSNNTLNIHHERDQEPIMASLPLTREKLKQAILTINHEQKILNKERYPRRGPESIVILVMVHDRLEYLEYLIQSLEKADGISDALLIFSHDYYSEDINRVIRQITFCQVMQIFYPYSLQVYQNEFPGPDANDCPRDITLEKAKKIKCNNWEHPDSYGHYREVRYVMTKHHWFWKLQHVFSGLEATKDHDGLVLLLEEDHYMAPDFYPMLQKMYLLKKE